MRATLFHFSANYEKANELYFIASDKGNREATVQLAQSYWGQKKYDLAEKYYLLAIEQGYNYVYNNLGVVYQEQGKYDLAESYYVKGFNTDKSKMEAQMSAHNLGILYKEQKKYALAEKYFLLAIEMRDKYAFIPLCLYYYEFRINKEKAIELVNNARSSSYGGTPFPRNVIATYILIKLWNGEIADSAKELYTIIESKNYHYLNVILEYFLYHHQTNLVLNLFSNPEFGNELIERFQPIYYAVKLLAGKEANIALKIPPEMKETVNQILKNVQEKQAFYYGKKT